MLKEISGKGLKGLPDFTQELGPKTLIVGRNGSGKSARSIAAMLLVLGYVPGCDKNLSKIMEAFASAPKLFVAGTINKVHFLRRFMQTESGATQTYMVNRVKATKTTFIEEMAKAGKPNILDLGETFLNLSDQKKIDYLFSMFPPAEGLAETEDDIDELENALKMKRDKLKSAENVAVDLTKAKASIELPAGTLAEVRGEIQKVKDEIKTVQVEVNEARMRERQAKEEADRKAAADKLAQEEAARKAREDEKVDIKNQVSEDNGQDQMGSEDQDKSAIHEKCLDPGAAKAAVNRLQKRSSKMGSEIGTMKTPVDSINAILAVAEKLEWATAVILVCKRELAYWKSKGGGTNDGF